jgi:hypothetical protein
MKITLPAPNRIGGYLTAAAGLCAALAPVVANLDTRSTAGVLGGATLIFGAYREWLVGWRAHEATYGDGSSPRHTIVLGRKAVAQATMGGPVYDLTTATTSSSGATATVTIGDPEPPALNTPAETPAGEPS